MTISVDYLPHWGVSEGLREFTQNWQDAAVDTGREGVIRFTGNELRLLNPGASMTRSALLIGSSSKAHRDDQAGKWGEGAKLGAMALKREDRNVTIRTPTEIWVAKLAESDTFAGQTVLWWHCRARGRRKDNVEVIISPVSREEYEQLRSTFLIFDKKGESSEAFVGDVLRSAEQRGRIYVKGIYVQTDEDLEYGYNLHRADIDRDRRMIDNYDLASTLASVWASILRNGDVSASELMEMLLRDAKDLSYWKWQAPSIREKTHRAFCEKYGEDVLPVGSVDEAEKLGHYGVHAIVISRAMLDSLKGLVPTAAEKMAEVAKAPIRVYNLDELEAAEAANVKWAVGMLVSAMQREQHALNARLNIVDFHDEKIRGMHSLGGQISLARKILGDKVLTLRVLVHEFCHDNGGDGTKEHVSSIEKTWESITRMLAKIIED